MKKNKKNIISKNILEKSLPQLLLLNMQSKLKKVVMDIPIPTIIKKDIFGRIILVHKKIIKKLAIILTISLSKTIANQKNLLYYIIYI